MCHATPRLRSFIDAGAALLKGMGGILPPQLPACMTARVGLSGSQGLMSLCYGTRCPPSPLSQPTTARLTGPGSRKLGFLLSTTWPSALLGGRWGDLVCRRLKRRCGPRGDVGSSHRKISPRTGIPVTIPSMIRYTTTTSCVPLYLE